MIATGYVWTCDTHAIAHNRRYATLRCGIIGQVQLFDERKTPGAVVLGVAIFVATQLTHGWLSVLIVGAAFVAAMAAFVAMDRGTRDSRVRPKDDFPPFDQPASGDPPVHVRRIE